MKHEVALLDTNHEQRIDICELLQKNDFETSVFETFLDLGNHVETSNCGIVIINLDNISTSNKRLRTLKMKKIQLHIIALSVKPFHPELEEAFREHISVCIHNPVESDELLYWLRTFDP